MGPDRFSPPTALRAQIASGAAPAFSQERFRARNALLRSGLFTTSLFPSGRGERDFPEEIMMSKKIVAALLLSSALVLSACNTVEGAGKDVQSAGKAVEKSAN